MDVAHTESHARSLVAIRRTDALARSAHFALTLCRFISAVEHAVRGENQVCAATDVQTFCNLITRTLQFARLIHKEVGSNHATITDDVHLALVKDARGDGTKYKLLAIKDNSVTSVRTASKTRHEVIARSKIVHHFTLTFVAKDNAEQGIYFSFCHSFRRNERAQRSSFSTIARDICHKVTSFLLNMQKISCKFAFPLELLSSLVSLVLLVPLVSLVSLVQSR